ncbi:MAG: hydrogenase maturation nickel metallochaperone HypA [Nitrospirales bacterium]|nr:hydrogenase maturation nickel metallochaperone HypA [Nitrospirales bacterium]
MHELHVMRRVVKMVEDLSRRQSGVPSVVRLQISSRSHLADHSSQELATTFGLATHGTTVQDAKLEIIFLPVKGSCQQCGVGVIWSSYTWVCEECGSGKLVWENQPEVVLTEVEYIDSSPLKQTEFCE